MDNDNGKYRLSLKTDNFMSSHSIWKHVPAQWQSSIHVRDALKHLQGGLHAFLQPHD